MVPQSPNREIPESTGAVPTEVLWRLMGPVSQNGDKYATAPTKRLLMSTLIQRSRNSGTALENHGSSADCRQPEEQQ